MIEPTAHQSERSSVLFPLPSDAIATTADDCFTPRWVFDAMGLEFDIDVASPAGGPWFVPHKAYYTVVDDGLAQPWDGVVWCNPPYSNFGPWARKWATCKAGALMGTYTPGTSWVPIVLAAADAVTFLTAEFARPYDKPIRPMHGLFVAFRGVGVEPAERLAAADKFGAVLYGKRVA
jgi:hypothetical protein